MGPAGSAELPKRIPRCDERRGVPPDFAPHSFPHPCPVNNQPSQRAGTHVGVKDLLSARAQTAQDAVDALLGAPNDEDERMNAETDAFAKQVEGQVNK